ncbi:DNA cytosine methyltransferase [Herbaspirillum huttiense]|uniref:DNA cytosine methyltransferase n=2 Tax=Herbaspirillum huttiense TaxID=863372 RepID=A0AAJ2HIP3_9BURK|nr:DNA cytosine methyltransferase [Herbaspirillum huttiense]MDR9839430.1 DNA cytosine methyltransferase [Herbaspirillum huttiense]
MSAYYNEIDPFASAWLRELIKARLIADGEVDTRSIEDVRPDDLRGFDQCHFFAGIGGWSLALRRAGWPDDRPVWTGSCPCQPFSSAGQGAGFNDERHLWPAFHWLIQEHRPPVIAGEQVASKDADPWLDLVQDDLEAVGYAFGAVAFPSAGIGAPHIRDRTYWMACADHGGRLGRWTSKTRHGGDSARFESQRLCDAGRMADAERFGNRAQEQATDHRQPKADRSADRPGGCGVSPGRMAQHHGHGRSPSALAEICDYEPHAKSCSGVGRVDDAHQQRLEGQRRRHKAEGGRIVATGSTTAPGESVWLADDPGIGRGEQRSIAAGRHERGGAQELEQRSRGGSILDLGGPASPTNGFWRDADWLFCRDGKWRPVEPGTFPLAHGVPARVGRLRGYGNAINAEQAALFVEVMAECLP